MHLHPIWVQCTSYLSVWLLKWQKMQIYCRMSVQKEELKFFVWVAGKQRIQRKWLKPSITPCIHYLPKFSTTRLKKFATKCIGIKMVLLGSLQPTFALVKIGGEYNNKVLGYSEQKMWWWKAHSSSMCMYHFENFKPCFIWNIGTTVHVKWNTQGFTI